MKYPLFLATIAGLATTFGSQVWGEYFKDEMEDYLNRNPKKREALQEDDEAFDLLSIAPWPAQHPVAGGLLTASLTFALGKTWPLIRNRTRSGFRRTRRATASSLRRVASMAEGRQP